MAIRKHRVNSPKILSVDAETLKKVGFSKVVSRPNICEQGLRILQQELARCKTAHSWKPFFKETICCNTLIQLENQKRPTFIFSYYGNDQEYIGSATIALKINNNFQHDGFPVIARAFIREKYRNYRLYFPILLDRIQFCEQHLGDELRGIHMGSNNPRIYGLTMRKRFLDFIHIGSEILKGEKDSPIVRDFIKPYPKLITSVNNELSRRESELLVHAIRKAFNQSLSGDLKDLSRFEIENLVEKYEKEYSADFAKDFPETRSYLDLLQNIPVLRTNKLIELDSKEFVERRTSLTEKKAS